MGLRVYLNPWRYGHGIRALSIAVLVLCGAQAVSAAESPAGQSQVAALDRARVQAFVDGVILPAMLRDHIAGAGVAVIDRDGVVLAKGYGLAAPGRKATADTLYRVGSISKTGTWIALMQLAERGKLSLDDPINDHLPVELRIPDEGFSEPIRIRHLMSHNAGFEDSALGHLFAFDPEKLLSPASYLRAYRVHRVRAPGVLAVYSNYGACLAGAIVAHESGLDWPTYAERNILGPLGMTSSTYRDPYPAALAQARGLAEPMSKELASRVTQGWQWKANELLTGPYEYVSHAAPAGALSMSANDAARYLQALLDPEQMARAGVLHAETLLAMRAPLFANFKGIGEIRHGFMSYDLGAERWAFGHDGGLVYHSSRLMVSPELGVGLFLSVNTATGSELLDSFPHAFFEEFFAEPTADTPRPKDAYATALRNAGAYRVMRRAHFRTEAGLFSLAVVNLSPTPEGDLVLGAFGASASRLRPIGSRTSPQGGDIYRTVGGGGRVALQQVGDRMMLFDSQGVTPLERVGFFEGLNWLLLIVLAALVASIGAVASGLRRLTLGHESTAAAFLDCLALLWLIGLITVIVTLVFAITNPNALLTDYPGIALPTACWLLLAAALATPLAAVIVLSAARPRDWTVRKWVRVGLTLAIFGALALTLWQHRLLGYSGWG